MASVVRLCAVIVTALIAVSFLCFAVVDLRESSKGQVQKVDGTLAPKRLETGVQRQDPEPGIERVREANHSSVREGIDDANDVLLSPFSSFIEVQSVWGERLAGLLLGLLLYGGGGLMLANFFPQSRNEAGDWREATS